MAGGRQGDKVPAPEAPYACAGTRGKRKLLHMGGSMSNMGRIEYSQVCVYR